MSRIYYSLYDRLLHRRALARAFAKVRRAKGAPGDDGQTIADFEANVEDELTRLVHELRTRTYRPHPVRRVTIPKPGGGERNLGIPAVRDRVVQQALLDILQPIFDPDFTRRVMATGQGEAVSKRWRKPRCLSDSTTWCMWSTWISPNVSIAWTMT